MVAALQVRCVGWSLGSSLEFDLSAFASAAALQDVEYVEFEEPLKR